MTFYANIKFFSVLFAKMKQTINHYSIASDRFRSSYLIEINELLHSRRQTSTEIGAGVRRPTTAATESTELSRYLLQSIQSEPKIDFIRGKRKLRKTV